VGVRATGAWYELAASAVDWLSSVDGYNLTYLRPDATAAAISTDDYQAPLVAFWRRGAGRVAAVTFPLAGDEAVRARSWPDYAAFNQTLLQWLIGKEHVPGIGLQVKLDGNRLALDLLYSGAWEATIARHEPRVLMATGAGGKARELVWERMAPGQYRTQAPINAMDWVRGAVQIGESVLPFGPIAAAVDPEWSFDPSRVTELKTVAQQSGGKARLDLSTVWDAPVQAVYGDLRRGLLLALLGGFLLETLLTRLGIRPGRFGEVLPQWRKIRDRRQPHAQRAAGRKSQGQPVREAPSHLASLPIQSPGASDAVASDSASERRQRFARAKRRGR
jgi:hypothetical protein